MGSYVCAWLSSGEHGSLPVCEALVAPLCLSSYTDEMRWDGGGGRRIGGQALSYQPAFWPLTNWQCWRWPPELQQRDARQVPSQSTLYCVQRNLYPSPSGEAAVSGGGVASRKYMYIESAECLWLWCTGVDSDNAPNNRAGLSVSDILSQICLKLPCTSSIVMDKLRTTTS